MSKLWIKAALVRAVKTFFQAFVSFSAGAIILTDVDWLYVTSGSAMAAVMSIAMSLAGLPEVKHAQEVQDAELSNGEGNE